MDANGVQKGREQDCGKDIIALAEQSYLLQAIACH